MVLSMKHKPYTTYFEHKTCLNDFKHAQKHDLNETETWTYFEPILNEFKHERKPENWMNFGPMKKNTILNDTKHEHKT